MVEDISWDFYEKHKQKDLGESVSLQEVEEWISSGEFMRYFRKWRNDMWLALLTESGFGEDEKDGLWLSVVIRNPPLYGFTYKMYKLMHWGPESSESRSKGQPKEDL